MTYFELVKGLKEKESKINSKKFIGIEYSTAINATDALEEKKAIINNLTNFYTLDEFLKLDVLSVEKMSDVTKRICQESATIEFELYYFDNKFNLMTWLLNDRQENCCLSVICNTCKSSVAVPDSTTKDDKLICPCCGEYL